MSVGNIAPRPANFRIGCLLGLNLGQCSGFGFFGLRKQINWDGIYAVLIVGVDVRVGFVLLADCVVLDVSELVVEVVGVSYAVLVTSVVPDFAGRLLADCEGVASFDVLNASCS